MSDHFTAVLTISQTVPPPAPLAHDRRHSAPTERPSRDVVEVAKVVVRAESLDALRDKVAAHAALL